MPLINLMVIYLKRKHGVPLHNFFEKLTSGTSYLKMNATNLLKHLYEKRCIK